MLVLDASGTVLELVPDDGSAERFEGILVPGLINCHCHLELSHMRGLIAERTGLVDFVLQIVTRRHHPEAEIEKAIAAAEQEMIANGIVAVGDICNTTSTLNQKKQGNLRYYNFIESLGWHPAVARQQADEAIKALAAFESAGAPTMQSAIVPHASYSVSDDLWEGIKPFFDGRVVSIHNQETAFEDAFFLEGTGDFVRLYQMLNIDNSHHRPTRKTSLQSYADHLNGARSAILVHNTFTTQADIDYLQASDRWFQPHVYFCLCVNANQYIEHALPPIDLFRANHCTIVLGTDSLASNHSLSILDEMKTIRQHFPQIRLAEMLQWATANGAKALGMDGVLGTFETGKQPGVVLIDENLSVKERVI